MRELLNQLADGQFHGGSELGGVLNISRAAVWKQIQKLRELGFDIQSVRGKGYRLAHRLEWLDKSTILSSLSGSAQMLLSELDIYDQLDSTNTHALQKAALGGRSGYVCLAEQQLSGRGRRGRPWVSPIASNLYLSILWEFEHGAAQLEGLSLAAGVAVVHALNSLNVVNLGLKWPNDLLANNAKVGGILVEMSGDLSGNCQVVLGVGINHLLPRHLGVNIDQAWTRVDDLKPGIGRNELAATVLSELLTMLDRFARLGFAPFVSSWNDFDLFADCPVTVKAGAEDLVGIARGIDRSGGLRLESDGVVHILKGGEVSLRSIS